MVMRVHNFVIRNCHLRQASKNVRSDFERLLKIIKNLNGKAEHRKQSRQNKIFN